MSEDFDPWVSAKTTSPWSAWRRICRVPQISPPIGPILRAVSNRSGCCLRPNCWRRAKSAARMRKANYVPAAAVLDGFEQFRRRFLRLLAERSRDHGPAAPPVPGGGVGGAGKRRPSAREFPRADRGLCRLRHGQLFLFQPLLQPRSGRSDRHVPAAPHRQRQGFPVHPGQPYLRSEGPVDQPADRLFDLAGGGALSPRRRC